MEVKLINITDNATELIYKAYRTCYSKDIFEEITVPKYKEKMNNWIKEKIDLGHESPLEHVSMTFSITGLSRAAQQQLTRHRTSKFSVQSQRYVDGNNFGFAVPELDYITDETTKYVIKEHYKRLFETSKKQYNDLIKMGVKKEDARNILPIATTGNILVTMDLRNFRNFLGQRLCKHAQSEIRELANEMCKLVKAHVNFVDYKVLRCQQELCYECKEKF